ncbi:hypothetical protein [Amycolatopsis sp. NBC_01286]|nr:hypothetical protein OG570_17090 [Amycolatopsis sp. NBC_01286]
MLHAHRDEPVSGHLVTTAGFLTAGYAAQAAAATRRRGSVT